MSGFHLAQVNIARLIAPLDDPRIDAFRLALDRINLLAEAQPGFVWRARGGGFDATDCRVFDHTEILINASVWQSIEHLAAFSYRTEHRDFVRRGRDWFEEPVEAYLALWWIPPGYEPNLDECVERLTRLRAEGPTPDAFDFKTRFIAPALEIDP